MSSSFQKHFDPVYLAFIGQGHNSSRMHWSCLPAPPYRYLRLHFVCNYTKNLNHKHGQISALNKRKQQTIETEQRCVAC